ncbi:MAG: hypothetical protein IKW45_05255 [Clostridia bacterium]|nr:hypothetical protein [Clostridia bacterium]
MAISKQDLKNQMLGVLEEEEKEHKKAKYKKAVAQQKAFEKKEKDILGTESKPYYEKPGGYDYSTTARQKRQNRTSESVSAKSTPTLSAKAVSSETDYTPAYQKRKQALNDKAYETMLKGEAYLQSPTDFSVGNPKLAAIEEASKGFWNRLRSAGGETVENIAYAIDDNIKDNPEERFIDSRFIDYLNANAKNVVNMNKAGQIGDIADAQFANAKENTGAVGDFAIDAADMLANMASQKILSAVTLPGVKGGFATMQGLSAGGQKYRDTREAGGSRAEAWQRGIGSGSVAAITEGLTGVGKTALGAKVLSKIPGVNKIVTKLDEFATKNWLTNILSNALGEGGEEGLEYAFEYASDVLADQIYKGEIETDFDVSELFRNVLLGVVSGAGFGAVSASAQVYNNAAESKNTSNAETPESPVNQAIPQAENVTLKAGNEQQAPFANGREEATRPLTEDEVKEIKKGASIVTDTDGNTYIDIESNILENVAPQNWAVKVKNVLRSVFPKGFYINGEHVDVSAKSRGEFTNSQDSRYLRSLEPDVFKDKMGTAPYIDVISQNAQYQNETPTHERTDNFKSFDRGNVTFRINGKSYNADVVIGIREDGTRAFHDIVGMSADNKTAPIIGSQSAQTENTEAQVPFDDISFNNNVTQDNDIVNKKSGTQVNSANEAINQTNDVINQPRAQEPYGAQNGAHPNTVGGMESQNTFYKSIKEFGAQPLRKEQIAKDNYFEVPKKIAEDVAVSENVGYMAGSELGTDDYMDDVIQHPEKYAHVINTDVGSIEKARKYIEDKGIDVAYGSWRKIIDDGLMIKKEDTAMAMLLNLYYQKAAKNETDARKKEQYRKNALDICGDINYAATMGGQLVQGMKVLQKIAGVENIDLKSDGEYLANRLVEKLNKDNKRKGKEIVLNQKLVDKAIAAAGTDTEGKAWDEVYKDLANQVSTSFWERVNNYRYWCMLSNPRTHVRNIVSNVSMAFVNAVKDATKVPVEAIYNASVKSKSKKAVVVDEKIKQLIAEGKNEKAEKYQKKSDRLHQFDDAQSKTTGRVTSKNYSFAWEDFKEARKVFDTANKFDGNVNNFIREHKTNANSLTYGLSQKIEGDNAASKAVKTILEHGPFGSVMDFNSWLLSDVEDGSFKQLTYAFELAQRMKANGITPETANSPENLAKMDRFRKEAFDEALYNTFNEDNKLADWIKQGEKKWTGVYVAVETLSPFKKVPLNIVKTANDYSVVGLAKGIGEMAKVMKNPGKTDPGKAINDIAKGLTGLELIALGAFLRSIGKITNGLSDDEKEKNFQKLIGEQAFAIKFDDGSSYSMEWLGSSVMPIFTGALLHDAFTGELADKIHLKGEDGKFNWDEALSVFGGGIVGALASFANPMIEMSMLSNLEYFLTNSYDGIEDVVIDLAGDYANQFVPQFLAAVTKTVDNTKRNASYVDKTDKMADIWQVPVQVAMSKIPGVSEKLAPQVDAWGREKKHSDRETQLGWALDAFISPGTYKKQNITEADKFLLEQFGGDMSVMPKMQAKYFSIDNERRDLSAHEYADLQKYYGQTAQDLINQLIPKEKTLDKLSSTAQADVIGDIYTFASQTAKEKITAKDENPYEVADWIKNAEYYAKKENKSIPQYIMERSVMSEFGTKEAQMNALSKTFGLSGTKLHETYYKANGKWNDSMDEAIESGENREKKVETFKKFKFSEKEIIDGYNSVIGITKKEEMISALTEVFGSKQKATTFYKILKGAKGYK